MPSSGNDSNSFAFTPSEGEMLRPAGSLEQTEDSHAILVVNRRHGVSVADVVTHGMCLSPMPSMRDHQSRSSGWFGHCRASVATIFSPRMLLLQVIAAAIVAG